jgi:hypothetical protein
MEEPMKIAVSLPLIVVLLGVVDIRPAAASRQAGTVSPLGPSVGSWSDVQRVAAGTELIVIVRNSSGVHRLFLSADASALFVLDLTTMTLSREAARDVRDTAATHAAQLIAGARGEFVNGDVRMGQDGVFVANRKLAGLSEVIRRIDRTDVVEVRLAASRRRSSVLNATATGAAIGAGVGFGLGATVFRCHACVESWAGFLVLAGAGVGAAVGASVATARLARPDREARVIYSAP